MKTLSHFVRQERIALILSLLAVIVIPILNLT